MKAQTSDRPIAVLRRRLTLLYAVTASLILTLVTAAFLLTRVRETRQKQLDDFNDLWNSLQFRLQSDTTISQGFLAQTETERKALIHIEENGTALLFHGSWMPETPRAELIGHVKALAETEGVFTAVHPISASSMASSIFTFQGNSGEHYRARVLVASYGKSVRSLCLIAYVPPIAEALKASLLQLAALEFLGVFGLSLISWYFVGWSLRPVAESRQKQAEFIAAASHELRSPLAVLRSGMEAVRGMLQGESPVSTGLKDTSPASNAAYASSKSQSFFSETVHDNVGTASSVRHPVPAGCESTSTASGTTSAASAALTLLSTLDSECVRMSRLIDDMLLLAASDAHSWSIQKSEVDMDTLLIDTYDAYLPLCRQKNIDLQLVLPEQPLPKFYGDAERIRQVLAILLDNAIACTPAGRMIRICAETAGSSTSRTAFSKIIPRMQETHAAGTAKKAAFLILRVIDQGPGIPDDKKARVFDRFYRADSSRSDKSHFGLGLSIAKELVRLHGGTIAVTDAVWDMPAQTGGSCFSVSLPCIGIQSTSGCSSPS